MDIPSPGSTDSLDLNRTTSRTTSAGKLMMGIHVLLYTKFNIGTRVKQQYMVHYAKSRNCTLPAVHNLQPTQLESQVPSLQTTNCYKRISLGINKAFPGGPTRFLGRQGRSESRIQKPPAKMTLATEADLPQSSTFFCLSLQALVSIISNTEDRQ